MFNSKFNGLLTGLLIVAIIGIVALIGYFGWSVYNKYYLNAEAKNVVDAFEEAVGNKNEVKNEDGERTEIGGVEGGNSIYQQGGSSSEKTYGGYKVLGTISIPKIKIEYPILEKATPNSIKIAVAYSTGVGINKVGNTVIQGHNYRNGLFFSDLKKLTNGDAIYITDETGTKVKYEVYNTFKALGTDASFYNRDTDGLREVTLSTCTDAGDDYRVIVLAKEVTG